ncbi:MAG: peptidase, M56 family protein [Lachnospiraceae bacterium]|nr:peptidase, M56 family protein [Lachnospiraceae bacterium]MBD5484484.1 peptidase, M56 family protein [Lachnospiraceae bacterium]
MSNLMKIVISLSFSGSILAVLMFGLKFFFRNRVSKRWQYYLWLIVVLRLLLPFSPRTSFVGTMFSKIDSITTQSTLTEPLQQAGTITQPAVNDDGMVYELMHDKDSTGGSGFLSSDIFKFGLENMWYVWFMIAGFMLVRKVTIYQSFVRYVKAGKTEVSDPVLLNRLAQVAENAGIKRQVELYTNNLVSSPLLIGFLHPCIVLPTTDMAEEAFDYTILHELTHFKHGDMFYKWLVQLTVCLHWFNPLVYFMCRDIGRLCEFACDEAVIKYLDKDGRQKYGDTLINSLGIGGTYKNSLASVTLSENGIILKERMERIMDYKRMSKKSTIAMILVTIFLGVGAVMIGAYLYTDRNADSINAEKLEAYAEENRISSDMQEQLPEFPQTVYVGDRVCRIRAGAGEEFDVVGLLAEGEELIILEAAEGKDDQMWYRIDKESLTEDMDVSSVEDCYIRSDLVLDN